MQVRKRNARRGQVQRQLRIGEVGDTPTNGNRRPAHLARYLLQVDLAVRHPHCPVHGGHRARQPRELHRRLCQGPLHRVVEILKLGASLRERYLRRHLSPAARRVERFHLRQAGKPVPQVHLRHDARDARPAGGRLRPPRGLHDPERILNPAAPQRKHSEPRLRVAHHKLDLVELRHLAAPHLVDDHQSPLFHVNLTREARRRLPLTRQQIGDAPLTVRTPSERDLRPRQLQPPHLRELRRSPQPVPQTPDLRRRLGADEQRRAIPVLYHQITHHNVTGQVDRQGPDRHLAIHLPRELAGDDLPQVFRQRPGAQQHHGRDQRQKQQGDIWQQSCHSTH